MHNKDIDVPPQYMVYHGSHHHGKDQQELIKDREVAVSYGTVDTINDNFTRASSTEKSVVDYVIRTHDLLPYFGLFNWIHYPI